MKESGLPNWAKTPDLNSKDLKQPEIIEEEAPVKKEPFSKRRDSSGSANGKRKDSAESKQKVEVKTPQQTPVKATMATPKKTPSKDKTLEKSPLKSPPSPSKIVAPGSPSKQRRGMIRSESAQVP